MHKCFWACANLHRGCGVLNIFRFHPRTRFAGKHDNFALDHDPQSLSQQAAWLAYCMAEHQTPKSLYGICLWQLPIPLVWRKAYLCALTPQHALLVNPQPVGFGSSKSLWTPSESSPFNSLVWASILSAFSPHYSKENKWNKVWGSRDCGGFIFFPWVYCESDC